MLGRRPLEGLLAQITTIDGHLTTKIDLLPLLRPCPAILCSCSLISCSGPPSRSHDAVLECLLWRQRPLDSRGDLGRDESCLCTVYSESQNCFGIPPRPAFVWYIRTTMGFCVGDTGLRMWILSMPSLARSECLTWVDCRLGGPVHNDSERPLRTR
jgi:hypothetical protein